MASPEQVWKLTKGDTLVSITANLLKGDGAPVDLTTLTTPTAKFRMLLDGSSTAKVNDAAAVIVTAKPAQVRYDWAGADVDTVGVYWGWFIITASSKTAHYPQGKSLKIQILDRVG